MTIASDSMAFLISVLYRSVSPCFLIQASVGHWTPKTRSLLAQLDWYYDLGGLLPRQHGLFHNIYSLALLVVEPHLEVPPAVQPLSLSGLEA